MYHMAAYADAAEGHGVFGIDAGPPLCSCYVSCHALHRGRRGCGGVQGPRAAHRGCRPDCRASTVTSGLCPVT